MPELLQVSIPVPPPAQVQATVEWGEQTIVMHPVQAPQAVPAALQVSTPVPPPEQTQAAVLLGVQNRAHKPLVQTKPEQQSLEVEQVPLVSDVHASRAGAHAPPLDWVSATHV